MHRRIQSVTLSEWRTNNTKKSMCRHLMALEIFVASLALGIFKSIMAAREYFKTGLNDVLRG